VKDQGLSTSDNSVRGSQTSEAMNFHADYTDIFGLLCMETAKSGGESLIVSAGAIFNEMLTKSPNLVQELLKPLEHDRRGRILPGKLPYYKIPIYTTHKGHLSVSYMRKYIESARRFPGVPPLTSNQIAALDLFDELANDDRFKYVKEIQQGDMQFMHNHVALHARKGYVDWPEENRKRHLLRVWLATPGARELPEEWIDHYGSVVVGQRGGYDLPAAELKAPL